MGMVAQSVVAGVVLWLWMSGKIKRLRSGVVMTLVLSVVVGVAMVAIVVSFWAMVVVAAVFVAKFALKGKVGNDRLRRQK